MPRAHTAPQPVKHTNPQQKTAPHGTGASMSTQCCISSSGFKALLLNRCLLCWPVPLRFLGLDMPEIGAPLAVLRLRPPSRQRAWRLRDRHCSTGFQVQGLLLRLKDLLVPGCGILGPVLECSKAGRLCTLGKCAHSYSVLPSGVLRVHVHGCQL